MGDLGMIQDVRRIAAEIDSRFGRLDLLISNAGIAKDSLLANMTVEDWEQTDIGMGPEHLTGTEMERTKMDIAALPFSGHLLGPWLCTEPHPCSNSISQDDYENWKPLASFVTPSRPT